VVHAPAGRAAGQRHLRAAADPAVLAPLRSRRRSGPWSG
jgi:hypothetical protein